MSAKEDSSRQLQPRPSWDEYFMNIVIEVAKRGTCNRGQTGCVVVKDKRIIATGYVGSVSGQPHCDDAGHMIKISYDKDGNQKKNCVRTLHAEQNAIVQAAKYGIPIDSSTIYCKMAPCFTCAKMLINSGIKRVVAQKGYHDGEEAVEIFKSAGVEFVVLEKGVVEYSDQS